MASLEKRGDVYRAKFRYGGRQQSCSLKTADLDEATSLLGRLKENLALLERGRLEPPPGCDLGRFLLSDGKIGAKPVAEAPLTLKELFTRYHARATDSKESNTRYTEKIHTAHLQRILGARQNARAINSESLQRYVDRRSEETNPQGNPVSHVTIRKEIGTFASLWNKWAVPQGLVSGPAPTRNLVYRKRKSKPPFQTWEQIERKVARGGLTEEEKDELWDSLFLTLPQIAELLAHVKKTSRFSFIHPMFAFAAHTGARRSEILRSQVDDFDFDAGIVRIREKKKDKARELTFRHMPMSPYLKQVMKDWFANHPGGQLTICNEAAEAITPQMAAHHFQWALEDSKWKVLKGWHVFRHSFCSNCAAKGIDQRLISEWVGHVTDEMAARYRHCFPNVARQALSSVFGEG